MTEPAQPGRAILRLAGVFTQVACAGCLLLGTIAFVMIHQSKIGGTEYAIAWAAAAMLGLVFGGLMVRGGLITLLGSALLDIGFGSALLVIDRSTLASVLKVLDAADVAMISDALFGGAIALIVVGVLCFAAIPQAIRYSKWLHAGESGELMRASSSAARSTNPGFPPPPIPAAKSSMWRPPTAPAAERRSRRRMYFALGGFAIGFGAGIGVLVSSSTRSKPTIPDDAKHVEKPVSKDKPTKPTDKPSDHRNDKPVDDKPRSGGIGALVNETPKSGSNADPAQPPATTVQAMLQVQHDAISHGDLAALVATISPTAVGFGIDADELVEGKAAFTAQIRRDLGELSDGGTVSAKLTHIGQEAGCAWIAEELELSAPGKSRRSIVITQLAAMIDNTWQVVGWQWAVQVSDDAAERLALLGTKPQAKAIASKLDGPKQLDTAVRAAFASRTAFVDARSERADAFNFGSGPKERIVTGTKIKTVFGGLRAEFRLHDGARVVGQGAWDTARRSAPKVAFALVNADYMAKSRAATDLTQTFRVFVVLVLEGSEWKIVLTQWSHGGPIR